MPERPPTTAHDLDYWPEGTTRAYVIELRGEETEIVLLDDGRFIVDGRESRLLTDVRVAELRGGQAALCEGRI
jgi:hypothetical protein